MQAEHQHSVPWQHAPEQQYPVMPPLPPAPQPGVVWLPPVANDRSGLRVMGGLTLFYALLIGFFFIPSNLESAQQNFVALGVLIFIFMLICFYGILIFVQARRWDVVHQRRQAAAAWGFTSGVPLAEPQPLPNIEALPLSFTIKLKRNWLAIFAWFCFLIVIVSSLQANLYSIGNNLSFQQVIVDWITNPSSFWSVEVCLIAGYILWASLPQSIEVTAQGLVIRHPMYDWFKTANGPFWKWVIPWSEARLFAIREGKPGASKVRYELSSPFRVVTFARIVRPRWWSLYRPVQPFGEYNAQMDALLALISARTGLLLYDVRQAPSTEVHPKGISPSTLTTLSAVLVGLSFACQVEGFPGVLLAKLHNDGRPVALLIEIIAGLLALGGLGFGYCVRVPAYKTRLLRLGFLCLAFAILGLILFPFGPFIVH